MIDILLLDSWLFSLFVIAFEWAISDWFFFLFRTYNYPSTFTLVWFLNLINFFILWAFLIDFCYSLFVYCIITQLSHVRRKLSSHFVCICPKSETCWWGVDCDINYMVIFIIPVYKSKTFSKNEDFVYLSYRPT